MQWLCVQLIHKRALPPPPTHAPPPPLQPSPSCTAEAVARLPPLDCPTHTPTIHPLPPGVLPPKNQPWLVGPNNLNRLNRPQVEATLESFEALLAQHRDVVSRSAHLHASCEQLVREKDALAEFADALRAKLRCGGAAEGVCARVWGWVGGWVEVGIGAMRHVASGQGRLVRAALSRMQCHRGHTRTT